MDGRQQLSFFEQLAQDASEKTALFRGALFNAALPRRDVGALAAIGTLLIEAEGTLLPPTVEDMALLLNVSRATLNRRLRMLTEMGLLTAELDAGKSAEYPKRRTIDWEHTAKLARRAPPAAAVAAPREPVAHAEAETVGTLVNKRPLAHHETTKPRLAHGETTNGEFEPTGADGGSVCLSLDSPPSPKGSPPVDSSRGERPRNAAGLAAGGDAKLWKSAERRLLGLGVVAAVAAVRNARDGGASALEVLAVVEHARSRSGAWSPAAIYARVAGTEAGDDPTQGWPEPSADFRRRTAYEALEVRAAAQSQRHDDHARQARLEDVATADAWAAYGPQIEALSDAEQIALVVEQLGETRARLVRHVSRDGPMRRDSLLEAWRKKHGG